MSKSLIICILSTLIIIAIILAFVFWNNKKENFVLEDVAESKFNTVLIPEQMNFGHKYASIHFTDSPEACNKGELRHVPSALMPQLSAEDPMRKSLSSLINTNCKYVVRGWRQLWYGKYKSTDLTPSTRKDHRQWFRLSQPVTYTVDDSGERQRNPPYIRTQDVRLIENIRIVTNPADGKEYYVANLKTAVPWRVYNRVCNRKNVPYSVQFQDKGLFLVFEYDLQNYANTRVTLMRNGKPYRFQQSDLAYVRSLYNEHDLKSKDGSKILYVLKPKRTLATAYVYMQYLCGTTFLHEKLPLEISFSSIRAAEVPIDDKEVAGGLNPLENTSHMVLPEIAGNFKTEADKRRNISAWQSSVAYYDAKYLEYGITRKGRTDNQISSVSEAIINGINDVIDNAKITIHWDNSKNIASYFSAEVRTDMNTPVTLPLYICLVEDYKTTL